MHSVRKTFHRREEDIKRARNFWRGISVGRLGLAWLGWDNMGWLAGRGFDSHQLNCVFFFFFFSFFHFFIFSSFHLSSYHIFIFHICRFAYFQKCSAHKQYAFRQEDVS
jgi:hypothetical protein